jgi:GNAT superfamily N-acetyltransferase
MALKTFPSGLAIYPARTEDAKALRMLLPKLRNGAAYFVAMDDVSKRVVGAAGMTRSCRAEPIAGPGVALELIEPFRRRGIATALATQLENAARSRFAARALYAAHRVEQDSEEMKHGQWLGFRPLDAVEEHVLPIAMFETRLGPLFDRLRAKGRVPLDARIIPLYEANAGAVLQFHIDQLGGDRQELYRKLRGQGPGAFHPRYSRVLLIGDRVQGCVLAHRAGKHTARVDANIVDPALRGGWANVWLKLEAARRALLLGIREFTFTTFDHYTDTRSFTEKLGGTTVRKSVLMVRPFASD